jgi:hypothetical protein
MIKGKRGIRLGVFTSPYYTYIAEPAIIRYVTEVGCGELYTGLYNSITYTDTAHRGRQWYLSHVHQIDGATAPTCLDNVTVFEVTTFVLKFTDVMMNQALLTWY